MKKVQKEMILVSKKKIKIKIIFAIEEDNKSYEHGSMFAI
jgi:hypothetical protein